MARKKNKNVREKGKIRLSEYFKELKNEQRVAIVKERTVRKNFPEKNVGLVGKVIGERGVCKVIEIADGAKKKKLIIHPIHLRRIK